MLPGEPKILKAAETGERKARDGPAPWQNCDLSCPPKKKKKRSRRRRRRQRRRRKKKKRRRRRSNKTRSSIQLIYIA